LVLMAGAINPLKDKETENVSVRTWDTGGTRNSSTG
jgi:hypothetical protein